MLRGGRSGRVKPQKQFLAEGIPETPGVYFFVDKHGTTLYVGKAKNLRARVRTYFNGGEGRRQGGRLVQGGARIGRARGRAREEVSGCAGSLKKKKICACRH